MENKPILPSWLDEQQKIWPEKQKEVEAALWFRPDEKENGGIVFNKSVAQQIEESTEFTPMESCVTAMQLTAFLADITPMDILKSRRTGYNAPLIPRTMAQKQQLGRTIAIPQEASVIIDKPGRKVAYDWTTVRVSIGIGKDHFAEVTMSESAWKALKSGAEININLVEEK